MSFNVSLEQNGIPSFAKKGIPFSLSDAFSNSPVSPGLANAAAPRLNFGQLCLREGADSVSIVRSATLVAEH